MAVFIVEYAQIAPGSNYDAKGPGACLAGYRMLKAFVHLSAANVNRASSATKLENVSDRMKFNGTGNESLITSGGEKKLSCPFPAILLR